MGHKKNPFDRVYTTAAAAGSNDVEMDAVGSGYLYCIQRIVVENEDNGSADVRILKGGVGAELMIAEEDQVQAATLYWLDNVFYLHEGQRIIARFTGCTAGDLLRMALLGWWTELDGRGG